MSKRKNRTLCEVCGHENIENFSQCRQCGTLYSHKGLLDRLRIFKRLNELELENKRLKAVIMRLHL